MIGCCTFALLAYVMAGLIGGAIPANREWRQPETGIRIHVEDNGIHTGIIVPKHAAGLSFDDLVHPDDLVDPRYADHEWLSFGWGDRDFNINTPTWARLNPVMVLRAAIGSDDTVMHVAYLGDPAGQAGVRSITLSHAEYRRLVQFIRASFADRPSARRGYGVSDAFYGARGQYSAVNTCNVWTGDALRAAGVGIGTWTPFSVTVMVWL